jgi:dephospho-CoA kinase
MLVIALTGGIGSGKSTVAAILEELGAKLIDTDAIAHQLTGPGQPGTQAITDAFGPGYLDAQGALDRPRMRSLVFSDPSAKITLESKLHPMIRAEVRRRVDNAELAGQAPYIVIAVPLLIESGAYRDVVERILVVDCAESTQVERVMQRSGLDAAAVRAIMAHQATRDERLCHADDIVNNDADLISLRTNVTNLHHKYLALARQPRVP